VELLKYNPVKKCNNGGIKLYEKHTRGIDRQRAAEATGPHR
jgi:hypothetical protein